MPRTSSTSRSQERAVLHTSTTSSLPPPNMAEVQKLVDDAISKARLIIKKGEKNLNVTGEGYPGSSRLGSGHHTARPSCHKKASEYFMDFVWAFLATFFVIYIIVTGYSMYLKVIGVPGVL